MDNGKIGLRNFGWNLLHFNPETCQSLSLYIKNELPLQVEVDKNSKKLCTLSAG